MPVWVAALVAGLCSCVTSLLVGLRKLICPTAFEVSKNPAPVRFDFRFLRDSEGYTLAIVGAQHSKAELANMLSKAFGNKDHQMLTEGEAFDGSRFKRTIQLEGAPQVVDFPTTPGNEWAELETPKAQKIKDGLPDFIPKDPNGRRWIDFGDPERYSSLAIGWDRVEVQENPDYKIHGFLLVIPLVPRRIDQAFGGYLHDFSNRATLRACAQKTWEIDPTHATVQQALHLAERLENEGFAVGLVFTHDNAVGNCEVEPADIRRLGLWENRSAIISTLPDTKYGGRKFDLRGLEEMNTLFDMMRTTPAIAREIHQNEPAEEAQQQNEPAGAQNGAEVPEENEVLLGEHVVEM